MAALQIEFTPEPKQVLIYNLDKPTGFEWVFLTDLIKVEIHITFIAEAIII